MASRRDLSTPPALTPPPGRRRENATTAIRILSARARPTLIRRDNPLSKHAMTTSRQATIAGVVVLDLLKAPQRSRVQPAPLCRAVGLDVASLDDPNARVAPDW